MKRHIRLTALMFAALAAIAPLALAETSGLVVQQDSKLWLEGSSTMHDYHSKATKLRAVLDHDPAAWAGPARDAQAIEALIRAKGVKTIDVVVPVNAMKSGKDGLDKNMQKALLSAKHPEIRFHMASYQVAEGDAQAALAINAKGSLTVAGVTRDVEIAAKARREGERVRLTGSVPLLMTQFNIKPPTMMMGTLRTKDKVVVHFDLVMGADGTSPVSKVE